MSEVSESQKPSSTLPKPSRRHIHHFWRGFGVHALLTICLLIGFSYILPWLFPGIIQSPLNVEFLEKRLKNFEEMITQNPGSPQAEIEQIRTAIIKLEQKLGERPAVSPVATNIPKSLIQLGALLRLEQAIVLGGAYEPSWKHLKTQLNFHEEDFPILTKYQHQGLPFSIVTGKPMNHTSQKGTTEVKLAAHPWLEPLSRLIKLRKHSVQEGTQEDFSEHLWNLLRQNQLEEALTLIQNSPSYAIDPGVHELQVYLLARKELQQAWKLWEDSLLQLLTGEEKSS